MKGGNSRVSSRRLLQVGVCGRRGGLRGYDFSLPASWAGGSGERGSDARVSSRRLLQQVDSHWAARGRGLPIGALTSQYLGNFYLDSFDHRVNQKGGVHRYLRYMDDLLFFGPAPALRELRRAAAARLAGLGLRIKDAGVLNAAEWGARSRVGDLSRPAPAEPGGPPPIAPPSPRVGGRRTAELQARGTALFAHARFGDDVAGRRMAAGFSHFGETLEPTPRAAGRLLEQFRQELPLHDPQQERAG